MELSLAKKGNKQAANTSKTMGKNDHKPTAHRSLKDPLLQSAGSIPAMFQMAMVEGRAASKTEQTCPTISHAATQQDGGGLTMASTNSLCLTDLQAVASDIKATLSAAIMDLKMDLHSIAARMGTMEQSVTRHADAIRQVQRSSDTNLSHILEIHRHLEDLDNRGRCHNIRIRGIPESVDQQHIEQTVNGIFNDLLDRPADSPIEYERMHRALRPKGGENEPPRDICCMVNFPIKEAILRKARERNRVLLNGTEIKLFQDLSTITLQHRRALRSLLDQLSTRGIPYKWKFPFCLSATWRGHTALLCTPDELQAFCDSLNFPLTEVPEWYSSFSISETWIEVSNKCTPRAQRQRDRRNRNNSTS